MSAGATVEQVGVCAGTTGNFTQDLQINQFHKGVSLYVNVDSFTRGYVQPTLYLGTSAHGYPVLVGAPMTSAGAWDPMCLYPGVVSSTYTRGNLALPMNYYFGFTTSAGSVLSYTAVMNLHP